MNLIDTIVHRSFGEAFQISAFQSAVEGAVCERLSKQYVGNNVPICTNNISSTVEPAAKFDYH